MFRRWIRIFKFYVDLFSLLRQNNMHGLYINRDKKIYKFVSFEKKKINATNFMFTNWSRICNLLSSTKIIYCMHFTAKLRLDSVNGYLMPQ